MANPRTLTFIFDARLTIDVVQGLGEFGKGGRRVVPITGGCLSNASLIRIFRAWSRKRT